MKVNEEMEATLAKDGFVTVVVAAALLAGTRPRSIYRWVESGDVKPRRVGGRLFVLRADVERMLGLAVKASKVDGGDHIRCWHNMCTNGVCDRCGAVP